MYVSSSGASAICEDIRHVRETFAIERDDTNEVKDGSTAEILHYDPQFSSTKMRTVIPTNRSIKNCFCDDRQGLWLIPMESVDIG